MKQYTVKLRIFRGKKNYDENGKMTSENSTMDLGSYKSMEWDNFMKNALNAGFTAGEVVGVQEIIFTEKPKPQGKDGEKVIITSYEDVKMDAGIVAEIKEVVRLAFDNTPKVVLTAEQQRISDLEARLEAMAGGKATKVAEPKKEIESEVFDNTPETNEELEKARSKYTEVFGKKPHHMMKLASINESIEAK